MSQYRVIEKANLWRRKLGGKPGGPVHKPEDCDHTDNPAPNFAAGPQSISSAADRFRGEVHEAKQHPKEYSRTEQVVPDRRGQVSVQDCMKRSSHAARQTAMTGDGVKSTRRQRKTARRYNKKDQEAQEQAS
jgi:hypothetical protein